MEKYELLNSAEMSSISGGFLDDVWEVISYLAVWHARSVMYNDNAPAVLAYK